MGLPFLGEAPQDIVLLLGRTSLMPLQGKGEKTQVKVLIPSLRHFENCFLVPRDPGIMEYRPGEVPGARQSESQKPQKSPIGTWYLVLGEDAHCRLIFYCSIKSAAISL